MKENRFYILDIARGLAAFAVVIFHYRLFYDPKISSVEFSLIDQPFYDYINFIYNHGWMAVQFFFVLSGFIFYELYSEKIFLRNISLKKFFLLRFSRLYPLHFLMLIIISILFFNYKETSPLIFIYQFDIKHFLLNIFLIQSWGFENSTSFNGPAWSVSIEFFLYGIFFTIFYKKLNDFKILFFLILASLPIYYLNKYLGYGIYCFFIGGITNLIFKKIEKDKKRLLINISGISLLIFLLIFLLNFFNNTTLLKLITFTLLFPSLLLLMMTIQLKKSKIGKNYKIIGESSYSVYLIHYIIQVLIYLILVKLNLRVNFNSELVFICYILLVFLLSCLVYKFFEIPFQRLLRNNL